MEPGKTYEAWLRDNTDWSFNEVRAVEPGKTLFPQYNGPSRQCFNEVRAVEPGKTHTTPDVRQDQAGASMRSGLWSPERPRDPEPAARSPRRLQ